MSAELLNVDVFENVFDALADTPEEAARLTARADLLLSARRGDDQRSREEVLHGARLPTPSTDGQGL